MVSRGTDGNTRVDVKMSLFSAENLRRMFGLYTGQVERRVANLPVRVERRQGPRCQICGVGTLHAIPAGQPRAGEPSCSSPDCDMAANAARDNARECVIRAS